MALNGFQGFEPFQSPAPLPPLAGPDEEIGCNGICLTPADIGLPEYSGPGVVAYGHPDCPEHGNPQDV
jgi:hypothetical protein